MVKGQNDKLKNKGFYVWMLSGVLVVVCICAVCFNITGINDKKDATDLSKPIAENTTVSKKPVQQDAESNTDKQGDLTKSGENSIEYDVADAAEEPENKTDSESAKASDEPASVAVMGNGTSVLGSLKFNEEKGLTWPVSGNVIMNYSEDKGIYFATLCQYKCNPAVIIGAEEGAAVKSAAKGVITSISKNEETGLTVKMSIGDNYTLTYGQLKNVTVQKGDVVEQGADLGKIAKPTKYYVVEGPNLYFEVEQNKKTVNPMYLLK